MVRYVDGYGSTPLSRYLYPILLRSAKLSITTIKTRMHSSRMRTVRCSSHLGEGVSAEGGCLPRGCLPRRVSVWVGCLPRRGVSAQGVFGQGVCLPHPYPREQNHICLWKHYLATTTLRTVKITTIQHFFKRFVVFILYFLSQWLPFEKLPSAIRTSTLQTY